MLNDKGNVNNNSLFHSVLIHAQLHMKDDDADANVVSAVVLLPLLLFILVLLPIWR